MPLRAKHLNEYPGGGKDLRGPAKAQSLMVEALGGQEIDFQGLGWPGTG
jgi:hypothetical protein